MRKEKESSKSSTRKGGSGREKTRIKLLVFTKKLTDPAFWLEFLDPAFEAYILFLFYFICARRTCISVVITFIYLFIFDKIV